MIVYTTLNISDFIERWTRRVWPVWEQDPHLQGGRVGNRETSPVLHQTRTGSHQVRHSSSHSGATCGLQAVSSHQARHQTTLRGMKSKGYLKADLSSWWWWSGHWGSRNWYSHRVGGLCSGWLPDGDNLRLQERSLRPWGTADQTEENQPQVIQRTHWDIYSLTVFPTQVCGPSELLRHLWWNKNYAMSGTDNPPSQSVCQLPHWRHLQGRQRWGTGGSGLS